LACYLPLNIRYGPQLISDAVHSRDWNEPGAVVIAPMNRRIKRLPLSAVFSSASAPSPDFLAA
jgi:hypothetical protein